MGFWIVWRRKAKKDVINELRKIIAACMLECQVVFEVDPLIQYQKLDGCINLPFLMGLSLATLLKCLGFLNY